MSPEHHALVVLAAFGLWLGAWTFRAPRPAVVGLFLLGLAMLVGT